MAMTTTTDAYWQWNHALNSDVVIQAGCWAERAARRLFAAGQADARTSILKSLVRDLSDELFWSAQRGRVSFLRAAQLNAWLWDWLDLQQATRKAQGRRD